MHLHFFELLLLPKSLLLFLFSLVLRLLFLPKFLFVFPLGLVLFTLFLSLLLLLLVFLVFEISFDESLFSFFEPHYVSDKLLFNFIIDHLCVVLFLGFELFSLDLLDFLPYFGLFVFNLIELLLKTSLRVFHSSLLTFDVFDFLIDALKHFFYLWQLLRVLTLLLPQIIYLLLDLLLFLDRGPRVRD